MNFNFTSLRLIFVGVAVLFSSQSNAQHVEPMYLEGNAQGTSFHITYYDSLDRLFQNDILQLLADFDNAVSTYVPTSVISEINSNKRKRTKNQYFKTCFLKAKELHKLTNGAFDPTIYPLSNAYGFGPGKKQKLDQRQIDSVLAFVGFDKIELKGNKILKQDPRVGLDFNAFAQGYSVDVIAAFLATKGITSYIVEIGGEVYAEGKPSDGENWLIGIEEPLDNKQGQNELTAALKLDGLGVATSGNYRRFFIEDGIKYVHHIDPRTGYPTKNNLLSATVVSSRCITSDALATGLLVMGLENAKVFLNDHPEIQSYLIYSDEKGELKTYQTEGINRLLIQF